jgi:hypothetical protein
MTMRNRRPAFLAGIILVLALALVPSALSRGVKSPPSIKVQVKVYGHPNDNPQFSGKIIFAPNVVHVGTVLVLDIKNLDNDVHDIQVNGLTSRRMGHNGRAILRVTFKKPGTYVASAPDDDASGISGTIKVVA